MGTFHLTFYGWIPIMHVLKRKTLVDFYTKYPASKGALEAWFDEAKRASWLMPDDIRKRFNSADFIAGNRVIFNICGNNYRLIVIVQYKAKRVLIRFIGTHKEYDKIDAEKI
jgi:mRNA interferase HigB